MSSLATLAEKAADTAIFAILAGCIAHKSLALETVHDGQKVVMVHAMQAELKGAVQ